MIKETYKLGIGRDINGNSLVKVLPDVGNGFSIQMNNGALVNTYKLLTGRNLKNQPLSTTEEQLIKSEVNNYVNKYGSERQKQIIKESNENIILPLNQLYTVFQEYAYPNGNVSIVGEKAKQIEMLFSKLTEEEIEKFNDWAIERSMDIREDGEGVINIIDCGAGLEEAVKLAKKYRIITHGKNSSRETIGTLEELIKKFSYTLETGASYERERGNKKINRNPKNILSLVNNLNAATNNAAANGYSDTSYEFGGEVSSEQLESKVINKKEIQEATIKQVIKYLKEKKIFKEDFYNLLPNSFPKEYFVKTSEDGKNNLAIAKKENNGSYSLCSDFMSYKEFKIYLSGYYAGLEKRFSK